MASFFGPPGRYNVRGQKDSEGNVRLAGFWHLPTYGNYGSIGDERQDNNRERKGLRSAFVNCGTWHKWRMTMLEVTGCGLPRANCLCRHQQSWINIVSCCCWHCCYCAWLPSRRTQRVLIEPAPVLVAILGDSALACGVPPDIVVCCFVRYSVWQQSLPSYTRSPTPDRWKGCGMADQ